MNCPSTEAQRLAILRDLRLLDAPLAEHLDAVCRTAAVLFGMPIVLATLVDATCVRIIAAHGAEVGSVPRGIAFCDWTIRNPAGEAMVVADLTADPRFAETPLVTGPPRARFYAGMPFGLAGGPSLGTLCLMDTVPRPDFDAGRIAQLRDLARMVEALLRLHEARGAAETALAERRETERQLAAQESAAQALAKAHSLAERAANFGRWRIDPATRTVRWSDGLARLFGRPLPEDATLTLDAHIACYHPDDRAAAHQRMHTAITRPDSLAGGYQSRCRVVRPDGTVREVIVQGLPERGADGRLEALYGVVLDVTEMIRIEREGAHALEESERRHRLLAENATDIIVWSDLTTRRHYVSPAAAAVLGYAPEELVGTRPLAFVHPEEVEAYGHLLDDLTSGRVERALSCQRYRHRDGRWIWLEISFSLTRDALTGRWDGYVAALRDITERKAMEEALRRSEARNRTLTEARLQEAQARAEFTAVTSAAILAQLAEGVIVTDATGKIILVNNAAAAIHGVSRLDVAPDAYSETYHLFTEDGQPHPLETLPLARAVRGETVREARWRVRRPDGTQVTAIGGAQPLIGADGAQIAAVLTLRDDTAREAAERSLRESEGRLRDLNATLAQRVAERTREAEAATAEAEAASRAKSEFLASMSHEIRTPLNGVIGYADLLLDEPAIGAQARRHAERIRSAGSALLTVVNDVLDFSKIEAGQIEIQPRPFALADLVDNAVSIVRGLAEGKGLALSVSLAPGLPSWLAGDEDRLRQVLLNLLNNALKFTPAGRVDLVVSADDPGEAGPDRPVRLRFRISDTGIGIPADKRDRLFRRFSQVDGSYRRAHEGTGLGLAICKSLVELMGGSVGLESRQGAGSTFWFVVPLMRAAGTEPDRAARPVRERRVGRRLLLAEDVALNQELACLLLRAAGHSVDVAANGAEALEAVQAASYDLVLMDVQMPVMDGVTATRRIRALAHPAATVPIVALTANVLPQQIAEFRAAGMDDHVAKPFDRSALLDTIDRCLSSDRALREPRVERETFEAMERTVGRERMRGLLAMLAEELDQRFGQASPASDRERLAHDVHAMIPPARMLGFLGLARLCREVETACRGTEDYGPLLATLRVVSAQTIAEIESLRAA